MKIRLYTIFTMEIAVVVEICLSSPQTLATIHAGAPNENIEDSSVKRILVFKR